MVGCGIYKPYSRPEVKTDGLYGDVAQDDTTSLGNMSWQEIFTDPLLQELIAEGLDHNTDLQIAHLRVSEAEAALKSARLAYLPSFNVAPQGSVSSFDNANTAKIYNIPITASWEVDIFHGVTNAKRKAKAVYTQSKDYEQAVKTQLIAGVANLYYTLLMLDSQYEVSRQTAAKWQEGVRTMQAMKNAGMANSVAVAQYEANQLAVEVSLHDMEHKISTIENSLATLLGRTAQRIERGKLEEQVVPEELLVGVPVQLLSQRPDVRASEAGLMSAFYATSSARSALYPHITLSGSAGWTNKGGMGVVNPGKALLTVAGNLLQPIFNAGQNRARVKIAKAQQEQALLSFQQTLLNAGAEVNNALKQSQTARAKKDLRQQQVEELERAVENTQLLMQYSANHTYLEVLTAQQSLLAAKMSQIADRFDEIQGVVNLYHALGGGRDKDADPQTQEASKR